MRISNILVGALLAAQLFLPIILRPSSASDLILHGPFFRDAVVWLAVIAGLYFFKKYQSQKIYASEKEKKIDSLNLILKMIPVVFLVAFSATVIFTINSTMKMSEIKNHGQRTMASVLDIYMGSCGKHGCSEYVRYQFLPKSDKAGSQPVTDYAYLTSSDRPNDPHLVFAETQHQVPVAYDTLDPHVSLLNFNDVVFQRDPVKSAIRSIEIFGGMIVLFFGFTYIVTYNSRRKLEASARSSDLPDAVGTTNITVLADSPASNIKAIIVWVVAGALFLWAAWPTPKGDFGIIARAAGVLMAYATLRFGNAFWNVPLPGARPALAAPQIPDRKVKRAWPQID